MNDISVKDVMTHLVVTLREEDTVQEAARRLLSNRISGAPVVKDGRLVGIVSEADLVSAYAPPPQSHRRAVRDVMTESVITVSSDTTIWEAAALIDRHGLRRLPVLDRDGSVVGILARADLVRALACSDQDITSAVRSAVEVLGPENFIYLGVSTNAGSVIITGEVDRKTTHDIAIRIASRVPGVLDVIDYLEWQWDDSDLKPVRNPRGRNGLAGEPLPA